VLEPEIVAKLAAVCLALPEAYQEQAWVGTRWRIRKRTFAHVLTVQDGQPPSYARAADNDDLITVLTFQSSGQELAVLSSAGHPFFKPPWSPTIVGMVLTDDTDWDEVAELLTESYCCVAPRKLAGLVDRPLVGEDQVGEA
jgi:predicted DNA-binding protein (MmcQ/YjbR family)